MKRKESHADTSGPPAGSMSAVHSVRDESACPSSRIRRDEGRFKRPDCPYLKRGRNALKIGTWNVRTLNQLGKLENLRQEMESLDLDVLGLSETRYIKEGTVHLDGYTFIYSGGEEHQHGVGFMVKSSVEKSVLSCFLVDT